MKLVSTDSPLPIRSKMTFDLATNSFMLPPRTGFFQLPNLIHTANELHLQFSIFHYQLGKNHRLKEKKKISRHI